MAKKRERLDVIKDILSSVRDNQKIKPTRLLYASNLSPKMFKDYIRELTESGLMEERVEEKKKFFVITEKGCKFLERYDIFCNFVDELGL